MNRNLLRPFLHPQHGLIVGFTRKGKPVPVVRGGAPTRLEQIDTRLATIRTELLQLEENEVQRATVLSTLSDEDKKTSEAASATDLTRSTELLTEWDTLTAEREPLAARAAQLEAVRNAVLNGGGTGTESGAGGDGGRGGDGGAGGSGPGFNRTRDPFDANDKVSSRFIALDDLRGRALDALEGFADEKARWRMSDEAVDRISRMCEHNPNMAAHVLLAGSETYHRAFQEAIRCYGNVGLLEPEQQASIRAALSLTGANGGFLIPVTLDPTVILSNSGSANPFRQISNVKQITTNFWEGVTSAGVNAGWLAEGAVAPDATPTFTQPVITPQKAAAWVFGSYEVLGDTDFAQQFPGMLADAKDRLEEAAFATGSGAGQPKGVVTAATTTVTTAGVAAYAIADIYALQAAIPPRFRGELANLNVIMNLAIINKTRQFDTAGGSSYWTNLGAGSPETVLGMPVRESTTMVGTTTTGSKIAVAGDFRQYSIVDRVGMTMMYEPMVKDSATARPTGQAGWFAYWRVGADAVVPGAFRTLVVQ